MSENIIERKQHLEQELREQSNAYQVAAAQSLEAAKPISRKVRQLKTSLDATNHVTQQLLRGTEESAVRYVRQKSDGQREYGTYQRVTLEQSGAGFVKRYKKDYLSN